MISKLLGVEINFNLHASNRSYERYIDNEKIMSVIDDPLSIVTVQKNHRMKFVNGKIVIIAELKNHELFIITVFKTK